MSRDIPPPQLRAAFHRPGSHCNNLFDLLCLPRLSHTQPIMAPKRTPDQDTKLKAWLLAALETA